MSTWQLTLAAGETRAIEGALRVAETSGTYAIPVTVTQETNGQTVTIGGASLEIIVTGFGTELPQVISQLQAATILSAPERAARDSAVVKLQAAQTSLAAAAWESAMSSLIDAAALVRGIGSVDLSAQAIAIDRVLQEAERRWWSALPACPVTAGLCRNE